MSKSYNDTRTRRLAQWNDVSWLQVINEARRP